MSKNDHDEEELTWCASIASSAVDELLMANLIRPHQVQWARDIVAHDLQAQLASGKRPPDLN